ncbi:hypothetical protein KY285_021679 [Solanum tuberosum]|nr:hypothetical protein KY289_021944 [Solanum tuberosum]KAH0694582.1 hypothetical protein KY285_021679 [Solanum tuberosum]
MEISSSTMSIGPWWIPPLRWFVNMFFWPEFNLMDGINLYMRRKLSISGVLQSLEKTDGFGDSLELVCVYLGAAEWRRNEETTLCPLEMIGRVVEFSYKPEY